MAEEKPRLARLAAVLTQLQSKRVVTAREIADRHGVSIRTVYRDIRTLEQSGVPIVTEEGRGYSILAGYQLPPVMFTEEEAMALITVEQLVRKNKDESLAESYGSAITKIRAILRDSEKEKTEFLRDRLQVRDNSSGEQTSQYLIQFQSHIAHFQVVEIDYLSLSGQASTRKIEPFALYTTQNNWVLIAYCRARQAFRSFRLDRIEAVRPSSETFAPHPLTLEEYLEQCRKNWTPDIPLSPTAPTFAPNPNDLTMQKVNIEPFSIIGISVRTTNANGQAAQDIGALWNRFVAENITEQIPHKLGLDVYSIYAEYDGDHTQPYTAILGCQVAHLDEVPDGLVGHSFSGGSYVKTSAKGDLMQGLVVRKWQEIWEMDLERTFSADFEVFGEKARNPNDAEVDFYIAVQ